MIERATAGSDTAGKSDSHSGCAWGADHAVEIHAAGACEDHGTDDIDSGISVHLNLL